jgi:hypothetical protein
VTGPTFTTRFGGHEWRVEPTNYQGRARVSIWPYYAHHDGSMKPGRGGLQIAPEEAAGLAAAIMKAAESFN